MPGCSGPHLARRLATGERRSVLHLHRLLLGHTEVGGGAFETEDDLVVDRTPGGDTVRFRPVPARETPGRTEELIARYTAARGADEHHPLLLIGMAVLDLLVS